MYHLTNMSEERKPYESYWTPIPLDKCTNGIRSGFVNTSDELSRFLDSYEHCEQQQFVKAKIGTGRKTDVKEGRIQLSNTG